MFKYGKESVALLDTVHPKLRRVMYRALEISPIDIKILEGVRTQERQYEYYAKGRTLAELRAAGVPSRILARPNMPKVTWVLKSNHFADVDGLSRAVDAAPFPIDWNNLEAFNTMADTVFKAAAELRVKIRWGADWDQDGKRRERGETDNPHFELV